VGGDFTTIYVICRHLKKKKFNLTTSKWFYALFQSGNSQEILSFIQVKQNKISWDKFLQIPANFEIISQQIWDWKFRFLKIFIVRGTPLALPLQRLRRRAPVTCVPSYFTTCTLLLIKRLGALYRPSCEILFECEARPGCVIPFMSSAKDMKKLSLLLLAITSYSKCYWDGCTPGASQKVHGQFFFKFSNFKNFTANFKDFCK
jgi:hypothetical protein